MGILGDWTAYNALNANKTLIDKAKTPCLQFSNSVLPLRKGNLLVSTPAALAVRFIIITTSKCLKQHVLNNFTITKRVYCFLSSSKQKKKVSSQLKPHLLVGFYRMSFITKRIERLQLTNFFITTKVLYRNTLDSLPRLYQGL